MGDQTHEIRLLVVLHGGVDDDAGTIEQATAEINQTWAGIGTVQSPPEVTAPDGTRSGGLAEIGAVCATFLPLVPDVIAALQSVFRWIGGRPGRTARIQRPDGSSIELSGLNEADQHALVEDWINAARTGQ